MNNLQPTVLKLKGKLHYLDGMRGLMAINVILCHFACVYYPQMYFEYFAEKSGGVLSLFATTPLTATVNGNIAVCFFMVLTGFLVGMSTFTKENHNMKLLAKKSVSRYFRLLPVVLISTVITHILMVLNLQRHLQITDSMVNLSFLKDYGNFTPTIFTLVYNVFIKSFLFGNDYIGPFWTIRFEFWGYILTLLLAMTLQKKKYRRFIYIGVSIIIMVLSIFKVPVIDMYYLVFIMGLFIADLKYNQNPTVLDRYYKNFLNTRVALILCYVIGIYFSCCTMFDTPLYSWWFAIPGISKKLLRALGIAILIFASLESKWIQKVLSFKPFLVLGECSFETYALHWPLMLSLGVILFIAFRNSMSYNMSAVLSILITLVIIHIFAYLTHYIIKIINKAIKMHNTK